MLRSPERPVDEEGEVGSGDGTTVFRLDRQEAGRGGEVVRRRGGTLCPWLQRTDEGLRVGIAVTKDHDEAIGSLRSCDRAGLRRIAGEAQLGWELERPGGRTGKGLRDQLSSAGAAGNRWAIGAELHDERWVRWDSCVFRHRAGWVKSYRTE